MPIRETYSRITSSALDIVFPRFCAGCGEEGSVLCQKCADDASSFDDDRCPMCNQLSSAPTLCPECRKRIGVRQLIHVGGFKGPLREALHQLKYEDARIVSRKLAAMLSNRVKQYQLPRGVLVPVPLAKNRARERGYNQSALIAKQLSKMLGWDYLEALERVKKTKPQTKLSRSKRAENVKGVFASRYRFTNVHRVIYLLDDVVTTGATLSSAIAALKKAGAKKITAIVVAVD